MCEEHYVIISKNDEKKFIEVKKETFSLGSESAKSAAIEEEKIFHIAKTQGYIVSCNGKDIYSPESVKNEMEQNKLQREKKIFRIFKKTSNRG